MTEQVAVGVDRVGVERGLRVGERLEQLVVDLDGPDGPQRLFGVLGGDGRDRLRRGSGRRRRRRPAGRCARGRRSGRPGTSSAVSTHAHARASPPPPRCRSTGCGRRVRAAQGPAPQHPVVVQVGGEREPAGRPSGSRRGGRRSRPMPPRDVAARRARRRPWSCSRAHRPRGASPGRSRPPAKMRPYPVQRHRLPLIASRTLELVGVRFTVEQVVDRDDQARGCRTRTGPRPRRGRPAARRTARPRRRRPRRS